MKVIITSIFLLVVSLSYGQYEEVRKKHFNTTKKIAINGYDPVSYFDSKPDKGLENYSFDYQGVIYVFSSQKNLDRFKKEPAKYEPAYGGWCAYAMGVSGDKVKIDPETYKITNGRLYLFYNFKNYNTLLDWNKSEEALTKKADKYWFKITY